MSELLKFSIRPYQPSDKTAIIDMMAAIYAHEHQFFNNRQTGREAARKALTQNLKKIPKKNGIILVAETDQKPIGFVTGWTDWDNNPSIAERARNYGYISDLYVDAPWRRYGVARQLLQVLEQHFAKLGIPYVWVGFIAGNPEAEAFYKKLGYIPREVICEKPLLIDRNSSS